MVVNNIYSVYTNQVFAIITNNIIQKSYTIYFYVNKVVILLSIFSIKIKSEISMASRGN